MKKTPDHRTAKGKLTSSKFADRFEQLETRAVLSGAAIVQPFSDVDYYGAQQDWALNAVKAPEVWAEGYTGEGVVIAVLDTGVDLENRQLSENVYRNPGEIAGNGIDDDRNGYVDDVVGWDFVDDDPTPMDESGHGTKVTGVIAAKRDGLGSTGIAYNAKILPIQILDEDGNGAQLDIANGIRYAVNAGADIINISLGGSVGSVNVERAINYALENDVFIVAASGNAGNATPDYPARYSAQFENVISVSAHNSSNLNGGFSNQAGDSGAVQVSAPGVAVYTTGLWDDFRYGSGTSFAAPVVSGIAALMLSANNELTSGELRDRLVSGATFDIQGSDAVGGVDASYIVASVAPPQLAQVPAVQLLEGDVDGDGEVGFTDFLRVSRNFGGDVVSRADGDLDGDGRVEFLDFLILSRNFGKVATAADQVFAESDFS